MAGHISRIEAPDPHLSEQYIPQNKDDCGDKNSREKGFPIFIEFVVRKKAEQHCKEKSQ
jgi:hypothetical protein